MKLVHKTQTDSKMDIFESKIKQSPEFDRFIIAFRQEKAKVSDQVIT